MRFIHIADIHVGMGFSTASFAAKKGAERRREIKETLMRVVDQCEQAQIDLLMIAGDMFEDEYVTLSELKDINHSFSKLNHTKVLISSGNHDPLVDERSPLNLIQWCPAVYIFDTSMSSYHIEELNTEVYSFSWRQKHMSKFSGEGIASLDSTRNNMLMLHGDVYTDNDYHYIDKKLLPKYGFDYVALGHIHKPDFIEPWLAYPGSLEPLDFSETGEHGYILGEIEDGKLSAELVPFSKRQFHKIEVVIDGTMTFEAIYDEIKKAMASNKQDDFYRIYLMGDVDPMVEVDTTLLVERLSETYYYVEIKERLQLDLDVDQLIADYEGTLIGAYIEAMMEKDQEDPVVQEALKKGLRLLLEEQIRL